MKLRPYQQDAHDRIIDYVRSYIEPCIVEAATGAGKSHIIAAVAGTIHDLSGKRVLCLQPSAELVTQNREKYLATGEPASVFSASAGGRCTIHPVVFGTPGTVKNAISRFSGDFAMVVVDECHEITPTIKAIIDAMRLYNPKLRVVGFTATPYRLGTGYIYRIDEHGRANTDDNCRDPYFAKKVFTIGAHELIVQGYLTPPRIGDISAGPYDTDGLALNTRGQFDAAAVDRAYHGHGRKTAAVVADVVVQSIERRCVILFAATIQHAEEVFASLPPELSVIITSKTTDRKRIIRAIKSGAVKYVVNVGVLTRGFDASHVDVVALLRLTESVSLLQQMIGRGLRLHEDKQDCLVLDYAGNIERHMPDGDLFAPEVKATFKGTESTSIDVCCPLCGTEQAVSARPNPDSFGLSPDGYFLDLDGNKITTEYGDIPAHYNRRCNALLPAAGGKFEQCSYRWTSKDCPTCGHDNDIAARYCKSCKAEIIDPNEKLKLEFKAHKRDPKQIQTDRVLSMYSQEIVSKAGNDCLIVSFTTEYRSFSVYLRKDWHPYKLYDTITQGGTVVPETVTYKKDAETGYYNVLAYNKEADNCEIS